MFLINFPVASKNTLNYAVNLTECSILCLSFSNLDIAAFKYLKASLSISVMMGWRKVPSYSYYLCSISLQGGFIQGEHRTFFCLSWEAYLLLFLPCQAWRSQNSLLWELESKKVMRNEVRVSIRQTWGSKDPQCAGQKRKVCLIPPPSWQLKLFRFFTIYSKHPLFLTRGIFLFKNSDRLFYCNIPYFIITEFALLFAHMLVSGKHRHTVIMWS